MPIHPDLHPLARETVQVELKYPANGLQGLEHEAVVEDWYDRVSGGVSWMDAGDNFASMWYGLRVGLGGMPIDNEAVYVKIGPFGHVLHDSEIIR